MIDPLMKHREEAFKAMLLSWFTVAGFARTSIGIAALIFLLGLSPNLPRIMASDTERAEFAAELPWLVGGALAAGVGIVLLGMLIAVVGGWLVMRAEKKRRGNSE